VKLKYLIDTHIVSAPISKIPNPEVLRRLERHGDECAIASVVWHELLYGALRLAQSKRQDTILAFLDQVVRTSFPILDYDRRAAQWHAEQRIRLEAIGLVPPFVDGQIAAIASTNGLVLVSANVRDFKKFSDLTLEDWTKKSRPTR